MKLITANKLNRFWKNGILPKLSEKISKTKVLTTMEQVEANTNEENVTGALVVGELINDLGGYSFGETEDGKPGYRKPGADTVTPFRPPVYLRAVGKYYSNSSLPENKRFSAEVQLSVDGVNWNTVAICYHAYGASATSSVYTYD